MKNNERLLRTLGITSEQNPQTTVTPKTGPGVLMSQQRTAIELQKAQQEIARLKNKLIPVKDIIEVPGRRRWLSADKYNELKTNLESNELIHPIVVRTVEENKYELVAGHNRFSIFKELGRDEIKADIIELSDNDVFAASFYSNLYSKDLSDYEKFAGLKKIQIDNNYTQKELAEEVGYTGAMISMLFSYEKLPLEALNIIKINPYCLGATQSSKIAKGAKEKIIEGLRKLVDGELKTEAQLVSYVLKSEKPFVNDEASLIKKGKKTFAELRLRKDTIAIKLKDASNVEMIKNRIEEMLNEIAKDD